MAEEQLEELEHLQNYDYKQAGSEPIDPGYGARFVNKPSYNPYS